MLDIARELENRKNKPAVKEIPLSIQGKKIPHLLNLPFSGFTGKYKV
jgi:hypothetical protein